MPDILSTQYLCSSTSRMLSAACLISTKDVKKRKCLQLVNNCCLVNLIRPLQNEIQCFSYPELINIRYKIHVWQFFHRIHQIIDLVGDSKTYFVGSKFNVPSKRIKMQIIMFCQTFFGCHNIFNTDC